MAVNIASEDSHAISKDEAEQYIKEYNQKLREELQIDHLQMPE